MKQETRAMLKVATVFGVAALGSGAMLLALRYLTIQDITAIMVLITLVIFSKLGYDIALAQIKYNDKLKEMIDKK